MLLLEKEDGGGLGACRFRKVPSADLALPLADTQLTKSAAQQRNTFREATPLHLGI